MRSWSAIGLPDETGLDLMGRIVALRGRIPAIVLTGYGMEYDIVRRRQAGFTAYMTRPIGFTKLGALIRQVTSEEIPGRSRSLRASGCRPEADGEPAMVEVTPTTGPPRPLPLTSAGLPRWPVFPHGMRRPRPFICNVVNRRTLRDDAGS